MFCPKCHNQETKVTDSRPSLNSVKRRRQCIKCGFRFNTSELIYVIDLLVEKRNGNEEVFDQEKLEMGIRKAFYKRPLDENKFRNIIQNVIGEIIMLDTKTVKSTKIGKIVLKNLKQFDEVAYICYWAMFGNFDNIGDFTKLMKELS